MRAWLAAWTKRAPVEVKLAPSNLVKPRVSWHIISEHSATQSVSSRATHGIASRKRATLCLLWCAQVVLPVPITARRCLHRRPRFLSTHVRKNMPVCLCVFVCLYVCVWCLVAALGRVMTLSLLRLACLKLYARRRPAIVFDGGRL